VSNPYDGIAEVGNSTTWCGMAKTEPLTADWLTKGFEAMRQRDEEHRIWQCEQAAEFRKAMEDPKFAARQAALTQACIDVGCPFPDPLNTPFISKTLYDRVHARADEILEAK